MNLWAKFKALLPEQPLLIGEVTAIDGATDTSTLALPGGGSLSARGTGVSIGQNAFVRGGLIEGQAPSLIVIEIQI